MLAITIEWGANLFITIVAIVIGIITGLSTTDYLKTKEKADKD